MHTWLIVVLAILFSAFFSGMEIAFVASNKLKFELEKKQKKTFSGILNIFFKHPAQYIATMLVGNNIALVVYGIFMSIILHPYLELMTSNEWLLLLMETLISTFIILIFAEFLPKAVFRILPNFFLNLFSIPLVFFYFSLYLIAKFSILISSGFLKLITGKNMTDDTQEVYRKVDINSLFLSEEEKDYLDDEAEEVNVQLFQNALDFSEIKIRDCMIPRTEIVALEQNEPVEKLTQMFTESGFSKILIYKENIDNIVGYVHVLDVFKGGKSLKNMTHKLPFVPESMNAETLLKNLTSHNKSIALVLDEFGGTAGIVTVEDIIEEIFGEINDEYDVETDVEQVISSNTYQFSARLDIDYLNKKYKLNIPETDDYETLAGFVLYNYNNIPKLNEVVEIGDYEIKIVKANTTKIETVILTVKD